MRPWIVQILLILALSAPLRAEGERAGDFDYYLLALSWSPNWCDLTGRARDSEQCDPGRDLGWVLHGLWPQDERGYPSYCSTRARDPSRRMTGEMADIMGTGGAAWYQWKKHGRCSGLEAADYFRTARRAYDAVTRPPVFRALEQDVTLPARVVEEAFLEVNPALAADMLTVTCRDGAIQEVRICLTRELEPRRCGADVIRDCTAQNARFGAID
ncbi:ribonuclease T [Pseudooceanicola sp. LIPI14-2-Ac024]|uniref:ribonuclease T2 family protein n=1 Tax=Pseudooceanicola sp. LIPI14-2-Ac024 TaxID=3344875 RepID=UPI0035D0C277